MKILKIVTPSALHFGTDISTVKMAVKFEILSLYSPKVASKLECRHTIMNLSGKKGQKVPEMVRRALVGQVEADLSSSISGSSSCQSNLDNIKPPPDMDSSILSIASISSEIAESFHNSAETTDRDKTLTSPRLLDDEDEDKTALDEVAPPTLMEEVSGATKTLVGEVPVGNTYTIGKNYSHFF